MMSSGNLGFEVRGIRTAFQHEESFGKRPRIVYEMHQRDGSVGVDEGLSRL